MITADSDKVKNWIVSDSTTSLVTSGTLTLIPQPSYIHIKLADGLVLQIKSKPSRIHRFFMKLLLGWEVIDHTPKQLLNG